MMKHILSWEKSTIRKEKKNSEINKGLQSLPKCKNLNTLPEFLCFLLNIMKIEKIWKHKRKLNILKICVIIQAQTINRSMYL